MNTNTIGSGSFGTVYKNTPTQTVIKVAPFLSVNKNGTILLIPNTLREVNFHQQCNRICYTPTLNFTCSEIKYNIPESIGRSIVIRDEYNFYLQQSNYGPTINHLIHRTKEKTKLIFGQVLQAIVWLHSIHMSHGDIKPHNITFLNEQAHLIDFGSMHFHHPKSITSSQRCTLLYVSPEELLYNKFVKSNDIWSFGCSLFEFWSKKRFVVCLLETLGYSPSIINQFESIECNESEKKHSSLFLSGVYANLTFTDIHFTIDKYIKDRDIKQIITLCLIKDPSSRPTANELIKHEFFSSFESLIPNDKSIDTSFICTFNELKCNKISYSCRKSCIELFFNYCVTQCIFPKHIFGACIMCFDRFILRRKNHITVDECNIICMAILMIQHSFLNFIGIDCEDCANLIDVKVDVLIESCYEILDTLDYQIYNKSPDFIVEKDVNEIKKLAYQYPFVNQTVEKIALLNN
jgi:serine/threonine protein kinase